MEKTNYANTNQRNQLLLQYRINQTLRSGVLIELKKGIHNDKKALSGKHNISKFVCIQSHGFKIHKAKTEKTNQESLWETINMLQQLTDKQTKKLVKYKKDLHNEN